MTRRAAPAIMMRVEARGCVPASGNDAEEFARLKVGSFVEVRPYRGEPSKALAAWWLLCSRTADAIDEAHTSRSISNRILLDLNMVETVALIGGEHRIPMSLTDFDDEQLWRLVEAGKLHVAQVLIPGVDIDALMKSRRAP
ncbi:hypothetical protein [Methylobacterium sp. PvR107]|uniref:hypothetical protein n=1 Tax=Methylobacterium sp. PvR107 TaxID=2806597 RepID=UPI001AEB4E9D|nr:hypothetical protein [Methylobacterium sp. PvR107]MBP1180025.1 hypothetical protein [Methylobacterium sp. PvR107]